MNDTPRTEAVWQDKNQNILEHARTLERELAAVTADHDAAARKLEELERSIADLSHPNIRMVLTERNRLAALNTRLTADLNREMERNEFREAIGRVVAVLGTDDNGPMP